MPNTPKILKPGLALTDPTSQESELGPEDIVGASGFIQTEEEKTVVKLVQQRLKDCDIAGRPAESRRIESLAMWRGGAGQWGEYNSKTGRWVDLRSASDPHRIYVVSNKLKPKVRKLIAREMNARVTVTVRPQTGRAKDKQDARRARGVLADVDIDLDREAMRLERITHACVVGPSFCKWRWNPDAEAMVPEFEDGEVSNVLEKKVGKIEGEALSCFEVGIDPKAKYALKGEWILHYGIVSLESIQREFPERGKYVSAEPGSYGPASRIDNLLHNVTGDLSKLSTESGKKVATRIEMWEMPTPGEYDNGRLIIVCGDILCYSDEWPYKRLAELRMYPFSELCYEPGIESPYGDSAIYPAIDPMRARNRSLSMQQEHLRNGQGKILAQRGCEIAPDAFKSGKPNEIVWWSKEEGSNVEKPEYLPPVPFDPIHIKNIDVLDTDIDEIIGVNRVSDGQTPPGVESGVAIQSLQDADNSDSVLFRTSEEAASKRDAIIILAIAQEMYTSARMLAVSDESAQDLQAITQQDQQTQQAQTQALTAALGQAGAGPEQIPGIIAGARAQNGAVQNKADRAAYEAVTFDDFHNARFVIEAASSAPQTPAARIQTILDMAKAGMFQPQNLPMTIALLRVMELEESDKLTSDLIAALTIWMKMQPPPPAPPPPPPTPQEHQAMQQEQAQVQAQIALAQMNAETQAKIALIDAQAKATASLEELKHKYAMELEALKGQMQAAAMEAQKQADLATVETQIQGDIVQAGIKNAPSDDLSATPATVGNGPTAAAPTPQPSVGQTPLLPEGNDNGPQAAGNVPEMGVAPGSSPAANVAA